MINRFKKLFSFIWSNHVYKVFIKEPCASLNDLQEDILVFKNLNEIPSTIQKQIFTSCFGLMKYRSRRGKTILLCLLDKNKKVIAWGWIQEWSLFKNTFGKVIPQSTMLGPFWTDSSHRGHGIYGKMIDKALTLCSPLYPSLIYAERSNVASIRGIQKKEFISMGDIHILKIFKIIKFSTFKKNL
jgi:hypothetical protein